VRVLQQQPAGKIQIERLTNTYPIAVLNDTEVRWLAETRERDHEQFLTALKVLQGKAVAELKRLNLYNPPSGVARTEPGQSPLLSQ